MIQIIPCIVFPKVTPTADKQGKIDLSVSIGIAENTSARKILRCSHFLKYEMSMVDRKTKMQPMKLNQKLSRPMDCRFARRFPMAATLIVSSLMLAGCTG